MLRKTHILFNALLLLIALYIGVKLSLPINYLAAGSLLGGFAIGTVLLSPDIDLSLGIKHRGITHTVIGALIAGVIFFLFLPTWWRPLGIFAALGLVASWLGHIIGDKLSDYAGGLKRDWLIHLLLIGAMTVMAMMLLGMIDPFFLLQKYLPRPAILPLIFGGDC